MSLNTTDSLLARSPLRMNRSRLLSCVTPPSGEPVTLAEAKLYLRVDSSDEDALIGDLIPAARVAAENWMKRSLMTQSWKLTFDYGIPDCVGLAMGPVNAITSVALVSRDTTTQTLDNGSYWLNAARTELMLDSMVMAFRVEIVYATGYGDAAAVPRPIKQGMLAHIAAMYERRGEDGIMALPEQAAALYMPFREVRL